MTAFYMLFLASAAELRDHASVEVTPTGALEKMGLSFAQAEDLVTGAKATLASEVQEVQKLHAESTAKGESGQPIVWLVMLPYIGIHVATIVLPRYISSFILFMICCRGRKRVDDERKAEFPAGGSLTDVSCCPRSRAGTASGFKTWLEILWCPDHVWVDTASRYGYMSFCGACCLNFFIQLLVVLLVMCGFIAAAIKIAMNSPSGSSNDPAEAEDHFVVHAMQNKFFLAGMFLLVAYQGCRVSMRLKMYGADQEASPNIVTNTLSHCIIPAVSGPLMFGCLPLPCAIAIAQEAEYVEVYHKDGEAPVAAPEQQPLVTNEGGGGGD